MALAWPANAIDAGNECGASVSPDPLSHPAPRHLNSLAAASSLEGVERGAIPRSRCKGPRTRLAGNNFLFFCGKQANASPASSFLGQVNAEG